MKHFIIDEKTLISTLQYLATKPYNEVAQLVSILNNSEEHLPPPPSMPAPESDLKKAEKITEKK